MSKFGLEPEEEETQPLSDLSAKLASFPPVSPRQRLDLAAVDAAAAQHGFVSRESTAQGYANSGRRRRFGTLEPTRHLAIRLPVSQYDRFVAYADEHQLTYHDALARLLSEVGR